ncbi:MAG: PriCT-2 domain-containing protein [Caldilineaceae bacterium]|nr:PriCT-2 domain-containing protein [Caldilineaceae bacterium]
MEETTESRIESALAHIPADDRAVWLSVGNALKTDIGDDGYIIWERWSRGSEKFDSHRIMTDWRSLKIGLCHLGTIFHLARQHGWVASDPSTRLTLPRRKAPVAPEPQETPEHVVEAMRKVIDESKLEAGHPYLVSKGFPKKQALVHRKDGRLILPMWKSYLLTSMQTIDAAGVKKFWPGAIAGGGYYRLGRGKDIWVCEGFATGLTLWACLEVLGRTNGNGRRHASVLIAFSAANIVRVAALANRVIADNDASGTGARYAKQTGLPWTMPDDEGWDLNDVHQKDELYAAVDIVRRVL